MLQIGQLWEVLLIWDWLNLGLSLLLGEFVAGLPAKGLVCIWRLMLQLLVQGLAPHDWINLMVMLH